MGVDSGDGAVHTLCVSNGPRDCAEIIFGICIDKKESSKTLKLKCCDKSVVDQGNSGEKHAHYLPLGEFQYVRNTGVPYLKTKRGCMNGVCRSREE